MLQENGALFFRFERDILAVRHRLTLAKLTQHLKVNTVIAELEQK